jgi:hypothetical protein
MCEINQKHIETKTIITLFVVIGYACCFLFSIVRLLPPLVYGHEMYILLKQIY